MREILFRGKRVDNGEWVEGFPIFYRAGQVGIAQIHYTTRIIPVEDNEYFDIKDLYCPKVEPNTVGQYTGITDKNGTKIFEGDVVLTQEYCTIPYSDKRKKKRLTGIVTYSDRVFNGNEHHKKQTIDIELRVKIINKKDREKYSHGVWSDFFDCEVIGNIHDNPELLNE